MATHASGPPATQAPQRSSFACGPLVLVASDRPQTSRLIESALGSDHRIVCTPDPGQALAQARLAPPDLIILDAVSPSMRAEALVPEMRAQLSLAATPIVVLSVPDDTALRLRLLRGGADDYVKEPFSAEELRARMTSLLTARAATLALRRSEEHLRALFDQASDGIFVADLDGRYTDVNAAGCQLLGCRRDELVGKTIVDLIPADQVERLQRSRDVMLHGLTHVAEWDLRRRDGTFVPVEVSAKILSDGRWIAFVRDISERRRALDTTRAMAQELERRVAERTAQLRALAKDLEAAEDRERRQLARDLHDDLAQTLAAARIRLAELCRDPSNPACAKAKEIDDLIARADRATRSLAAQLAPAVLYELGLVPALEWLAEEIERSHGLRVHVRDDGADKPLSQEARSIVYRAVRELLINVAKHADADSAFVDTERSGERLVVRVSDAGVGFTPTAVEPRSRGRGLGLVSIHERLGFIGGTAQVHSIPGDGTVATLCAPLAAESAVVRDEA